MILQQNMIFNILLNLSSGLLGALLLYIFQKKNERKKEEEQAQNLAIILRDQLDILYELYSNSEKPDYKEALKSLDLWEGLIPMIINLLPFYLVSSITSCFKDAKYSFHENKFIEYLNLGMIEFTIGKLDEFIYKNDKKTLKCIKERNMKRFKKKQDVISTDSGKETPSKTSSEKRISLEKLINHCKNLIRRVKKCKNIIIPQNKTSNGE